MSPHLMEMTVVREPFSSLKGSAVTVMVCLSAAAPLCVGTKLTQSDDVLTSHWLFVERVRLELPPSSVKCRLSLLSSIE